MKLFQLLILALMAGFAISCDSNATADSNTQEATPPATTVAEQPQEEVQPTGVSVGDKAPDFSLKDVDGETYSFDDVKAADGTELQGYIVIFTCNTCPYAVATEQRVIDLHEKYAAQGYPVVAIQPNDPAAQPGDSYEAMKTRAKEQNYGFLYLFDEGQKVYPQYGATRTPEVYLLDADRIIRYHGAIDDNTRDAEGVEEKFVEKAIEALQNGKKPEPAKTKAVGCTIKTV